MIEKFVTFLPSILIIAGIAGATWLYVRLIIKCFGDKLKSVEWCHNNRRKISRLAGIPAIYLLAPAREELITRAPLVIAFDEISPAAWCGIFVSACVFALMHWRGSKIFLREMWEARKSNEHQSDNIEEEAKRISAMPASQVLLRKISHVVSTFLCGGLFGYCGIKYQSIWLCVGLHAAWNIFMPILLPILVVLITLILCGAVFLFTKTYDLWDGIRYKWFKPKW